MNTQKPTSKWDHKALHKTLISDMQFITQIAIHEQTNDQTKWYFNGPFGKVCRS